MNSKEIDELKNEIESADPSMKLFVLDPNTMTEAELAEQFNKAKEANDQFQIELEAMFKQIHNDNIGAPIERYYEDAENICGDSLYLLAKIKSRIKKHFDER